MSQFLVPGLVMTSPQRQHAKDIRDHYRERENRGGINQTDFPPIPSPIKLTDVQLAKWWYGRVLHIREYVQEYPSHALIELDLYDSNGTASLLNDLFQAYTDAYLTQGGGGGGDASSSGGAHPPGPTGRPQAVLSSDGTRAGTLSLVVHPRLLTAATKSIQKGRLGRRRWKSCSSGSSSGSSVSCWGQSNKSKDRGKKKLFIF
jgi:hypothetical protein